MLQQSKLGFLVFFVALFLSIFLTRSGSLSPPAPRFSLPETNGGQVDLESYRGRPVLLVFWVSSCSICQRELPLLNQLEPAFRSRGIAVVTIHLGGEGAARDYMSSHSIGLTSLFDDRGAVGKAYHVGGVPRLVLIGRDGKVIRSMSGWTEEGVLRGWMDAASAS